MLDLFYSLNILQSPWSMFTHKHKKRKKKWNPLCNICVFNQHVLGKYVGCFFWARQLCSGSCLVLSQFKKERKKAHGQLSQIVGVGSGPQTGLQETVMKWCVSQSLEQILLYCTALNTKMLWKWRLSVGHGTGKNMCLCMRKNKKLNFDWQCAC